MFKRLVFLVVVLLILSGSTLYAQAPAMQWHKGYGTDYEEHVHEGMQARDGGYIAIGHTWEGETQYTDMLVIKTDANGNWDWQTIVGTNNKYDVGICVAEASDGFICGGGLYNSGNQKSALVKLDSDGNVVSGWPKYYSGSQNCAVRGIEILGDGSVVATGYTGSSEQGYVFIVDDGDGFIMKTDSSGNLQWSEPLSAAQGTKVRQDGNGYTLCSTGWYFDGGDHQDAVLIRTDSNGNETNSYHYGGSGDEHCYDFDLTSDGGYILAGHTTSYGVANWDYYLVKVNSSGSEEWHKTFGQPRGYDANYIHDESYGVRQTPDGGYIIAGGSGDEYDEYSECGHPAGCSGEWKAYLVRTNESGNLLWEGIYGDLGEGNNSAEYIGLTSDGGYIVFTDTDSQTPPPPNNFGFMKIEPDMAVPTDPDLDGSGGIDFEDFALFALQWGRTDCGLINDWCNGADFYQNNDVSLSDLSVIVTSWLTGDL